MVDLTPGEPTAVTQVTQSKVGNDAFALPNRVGIAPGLESLGKGLDDLAVPLGQAQAQSDVAANAQSTKDAVDAAASGKAAQIGPDGVPQVATPANSFILGRAGDAYNHAVDAGTKANAQAQISETLTRMQQANITDPAGFQAAANSFAENLRGQFDPAAGNALATQVHNEAAQRFGNLFDASARRDVSTSLQSITTQIADTNSKMQALALGGLVSGPQYDQLKTQLGGLYDSLGSNKLFNYSQDKIDSEKNHAFDTINGQYLVGRVDDTFNKKGKAAAQEVLEGIRTDPSISLSMPERDHLYAQGMSHLSFLSGEQQAASAALQPRVNDSIRILATGNDPRSPEHLTEQQLNDTHDAITAIGDVSTAQKFDAARFAADRTVAMKGLTPDQRAATLFGAANAGVGGPIAAGANNEAGAIQFFQSKGWSQAQAVGIVANLVHESGGKLNPGAINPGDGSDGSDSIGIGQWNSTRAADLKAFAAAQGKPYTDFGTQLAFVQHELEGKESAAAQKLRGAATPQDAVAAFALGYERPQGFQTGNFSQVAGSQNRLDQATRLAGGGASTAGIMTVGAPYTTAEGIANPRIPDAFMTMNAIAAKDEVASAKRLATTLENGVKFSGNVTPDMVPVAAQVYQAASRNPELAETAAKVQGVMTGTPAGFAAAGKPDSGNDFETQARALAAGPDILRQQVGEAAIKGLTAGRKLLDENAPEYAYQNGWIKQRPPTLNLMPPVQQDGSPAPGVAPVSDQIAGRVQAAINIGSFTKNASQPLFTKGEVDQVKSLATNGTADQKVALLGAITNSNAPLPIVQATLKQLAGAPETQAMAVAGIVAPDNADVARGILNGQDLLKQEPKFAPHASDLQTAFAKAFPPNDFPNVERRDAYLKAATGYYANLSASANDASGKLDQTRFDNTMRAVTGGVLSFRGSQVQAPWYGATGGQFSAAIQSLTPADMAGAVTSTGAPLPVAQLQSRVIMTGTPWRLESTGTDGKYLVYSGDDAARSYLRNSATGGSPFVLDLSGKRGIEPGLPKILLPPNISLPGKPNLPPPAKGVPSLGLTP